MWHLITCEYAPRLGGVADFTRAMADVLSCEAPVHVWAPAPATGDRRSVIVHELELGFAATSLVALDRQLSACRAPRRLFVNWVPHGYGYKSLNVPFCLWIRRRAQRGDEVDLMVHEPFLPFDRRRVRQSVAAAIHRLMLRVLLGAASRVWVSTSSFGEDIRRFAPRPVRPTWLPVMSPLVPVDAPGDVRRLRAALAGRAPIVGHFGTCDTLVAPILTQILEQLSAARPDLRFIVVGRHTDTFVDALAGRGRVSRDRIVRSGEQNARDLSLLLQCCDLFVQPYHDGVSARRTTLMALLQHGSAVVTAGGSRTEELWRKTGAVYLLPHGDPALFASAALELLGDPAACRDLGERARVAYANYFDMRHLRTALSAPATA